MPACLVHRLGPTHMAALQRTQSAALRIATGCVRSTPIPHLHAESRVLSLKEHTDMRGLQFFAEGLQRRTHLLPSSQPLSYQPQPSHHTCVEHCSSPLLHPPTPLDRNHNSWIHQQCATRYLKSAPQNSLLGEPPPPLRPRRKSSFCPGLIGYTSAD